MVRRERDREREKGKERSERWMREVEEVLECGKLTPLISFFSFSIVKPNNIIVRRIRAVLLIRWALDVIVEVRRWFIWPLVFSLFL